MALLQLNIPLLYSAVINACYELISHREALNAINLFPVADGDTGNNMASTVEAIIHHSEPKETLIETVQSIANGAIIGARGNSGMIFSQFFNGWLEEELPDALNPNQFSTIMTAACRSVRNAIVNPVEGTMLTVMEAFARSFHLHSQLDNCFLSIFQKVIPDMQKSLAETTFTLEILKEAHVVDAGAMGFSLFMENFASSIAEQKSVIHKKSLDHASYDSHDLPMIGELPEKRYCTEALIAGDCIEKDQLTELLQQHGDSIVLTGNEHLSRLHLHCNQPWQVFDQISDMGRIQSSKIDDMLRQYEVIHHPKYKIALVTDSSANLPQDFIDEYQIHLIALNVQMNGHALLDKWGLDNEFFYEKLHLASTYPTTSCPSPAFMAEKFNHLSKHYDQVIVVSVAQALSATYHGMVSAAKDFNNVHIINSCHIAGSQGLLVSYAAELIEQGYDAETIIRKVNEKIPNTHFFVMVNQFDSLIRSGRVGKLKGMFAQFTGMRPIISLDGEGKVILTDKAFNEVKALAKIINETKTLEKNKRLKKYCIIHAGAKEKAEEFAHMTTEAFSLAPAFIEPVSTAIGLHAGKGCIALACMMD